MKLAFDLTRKDYVALNYYIQWAAPALRWKRLMYNTVPYFFIALLLLEKYWGIPWNSLAYTGMIAVALMFLFRIFLYTRWGAGKIVDRVLARDPNRFYEGRRDMTLDEQGLTLASEKSSSTIAWNGFTTLGEDKEYLFLFINKRQAVILPKRLFLLPQELYDVKRFIESRLPSGKNRNAEP